MSTRQSVGSVRNEACTLFVQEADLIRDASAGYISSPHTRQKVNNRSRRMFATRRSRTCLVSCFATESGVFTIDGYASETVSSPWSVGDDEAFCKEGASTLGVCIELPLLASRKEDISARRVLGVEVACTCTRVTESDNAGGIDGIGRLCCVTSSPLALDASSRSSARESKSQNNIRLIEVPSRKIS